MSELERLIIELCPNGVRYKKVSDLADTFIGLATSVTKYKTENGVMLLHNSDIKDGRIEVKNYEYISEDFAQKNSKKILRKNDIITIHTGDVGTSAVISDEYDGTIGFTTISSRIRNYNEITPDFLCKYLNSQLCKSQIASKTISDRNNLNLAAFDELLIPVPPIEVQGEIVRILDDFTAVTTNLIETLNEEFIARRKQYECYREIVLDKNENVEWVPLLEISDTFTGLTYKPSDVASSGTIVLRSSNIQNRKLVFDDNVYVQMDNIPQRAIVQEDDILICVRNGSKALIGKAAMIPQHTQPMAFGAFMTILRAKKQVNPKYLFFVWQSPRIQNMIHGESGMPINQITKKMLEQILVPLPTLEEQQKVVEVLEQFDLVYSELSTSLPAEIEARQKQYEYYRDKLLTFKEASE